MKQTAFLLGAYDRFNYGDLLFPIIVEEVLRSYSPELACIPYALVKSDLSEFDAKRTRPINELFSDGRIAADSAIIVAGGGVIGASWASMRLNLSSGMETRLLKLALRVVGADRFDDYCRKRFGSPSAWPWVVAPKDFSVPVKVVYNGVGGSYLGRLGDDERNRIMDKLSDSAFLSVRDAETKRILAPIDSEQRVRLVPDSAVVMSRLFPRDRLRGMIRPSTAKQIDHGRPYICFQMATGYELERYEEMAEIVEKIACQYDWGIVLLPIGRAQGHEDHVVLRRFRSHFEKLVYLAPDNIGIFDIMALIANAKLFVGTSLHGAVTSQSFAVPHLALAGVTKLDFYLKTWEIPSQVESVSFGDLPERAAEVLAQPTQDLERNRDRLIDIAMRNFAELARAAGIRSAQQAG